MEVFLAHMMDYSCLRHPFLAQEHYEGPKRWPPSSSSFHDSLALKGLMKDSEKQE